MSQITDSQALFSDRMNVTDEERYHMNIKQAVDALKAKTKPYLCEVIESEEELVHGYLDFEAYAKEKEILPSHKDTFDFLKEIISSFLKINTENIVGGYRNTRANENARRNCMKGFSWKNMIVKEQLYSHLTAVSLATYNNKTARATKNI